ncbi:MAG: hydroxymethylbilane synthase [Alphaproteobacteria bacterium]|nr:hydroxymethylbilane synthase [Alphaproteobacteria bacterium]
MTVKSEYTYPEKLVIGTRGSPLALIQANMVKDKIETLGQGIDVQIKIITTSGDWKPEHGEKALKADAGGKAQFAKEIEEALLADEVDIAVHSMKDMEADLPHGLIIPYMLPREDVRDVFISNISQNIFDLTKGSIVGTVSVRRQAFLLALRPDLKVVPLRGNVETRLEKLKSGQVDATFLALAGLKRLGLENSATSIVDLKDMLPSVGQGAIGIELKSDRSEELSFVGQFSCFNTVGCVSLEREVLRGLGGSCHTPVGILSRMDKDIIHLETKVVSPDGKQVWAVEKNIPFIDMERAKKDAFLMGQELRRDVPTGIL